ncbi:bifunctional protein-serine/threonine kinase/phosphatase [Paracraurococcus lichenis]|uniref:Protein phosphatase 2C domain-containing protein n=1 Tax=Paracraurococcus lichenis TaxID=3064888 RepID=A0ABT9DY75_9PROT|nr:bifunctional protein-serine/threonine kinase/phosphatase [Paracraurococcus sp. LOR1-02]MDO9708853.1 protein phosphatase 2C domain-containing protein [Paracraurococcus sp. LOR1-02]
MPPETGTPARGRLELRVGLCSDRGPRPANEDYAAAWVGEPGRREAIAALADGVGGAKGGRVAAELAVRGLIDGLLGQSQALGIQRTAGRAIEALNGWIHAKGQADPDLAGMACTLTAVVLRGRRMHVLHVGDSRLYRFRDGALARLTEDHAQRGANVLTRALGAAESVRVDYAEEAARPHDRLLLCSDGVHGGLADAAIAAELARRGAPEDTARRLVGAALAAGAADNATALVLDLLDLPPPVQADLEAAIDARPILPPPRRGTVVDGYALEEMIADSRTSRVFRGLDTLSPGTRAVVLKFPKPGTAAEASFRQAYLREGWIAARIRSPYLGEVLEPPPERASCLYAVMPWYGAETLERRILRGPPMALEAGLGIATRLCRAVAALHRAGVIHRDIKPDNVILEPGGGLRLIDLGVARLPHMDDFAAEDIPGTPSYMAPELLAGSAEGDERTDLYALGVTLWRMFAGAFPHGEVEAFSRPRFGAPASLLARRPDLPAWLDQALSRAVAVAPEERFGDAVELLFTLERGMAGGAPARPRPRSLHDRDPLLFWRVVSAGLALLLLLSWAMR